MDTKWRGKREGFFPFMMGEILETHFYRACKLIDTNTVFILPP